MPASPASSPPSRRATSASPPASGTATVLGPVYANTAATTITVGAGATLALPGPLDNGFFTVTKAGQGTLFLGGDNMGDGFTTGLAAFSIGSTTANGGTVRVADGAALVVQVQPRKLAPIEPARTMGVRPGWGRFYVEARTLALLTGRSAIGEQLRYLVDLPLDPKGKPAMGGRCDPGDPRG